MSLNVAGKSTSEHEITNISQHGMWIWVNQKEYFISFDDFPMFKNASLESIFKMVFYPPNHLRWGKLDIDIELESLENPEAYPLVYSR